jgi:hypothetical protein
MPTPTRQLWSLTASAKVLNSATVRKPAPDNTALEQWQADAWDHFDTVGEFRFGVNWIGNGLSRVNLGAARIPTQPGAEPTPIVIPIDPAEAAAVSAADRAAVDAVNMIAGGPSGQGQMNLGFAQNLTVAGSAWLVADVTEDGSAYTEWNVYSQDSIRSKKQAGETIWQRRIGDGTADRSFENLHPDALVVRCWRSHPARKWEPDSPVRASLRVLDTIDLLSAHITATARSRLAGAGLLAVPAEAEFPDPPPDWNGASDDEDILDQQQARFDYFVEQLRETMTTPIRQRDVAGAVVPHVIAIPGELIDKLTHLSFSTPFDSHVLELLVGEIRRLALSLDMPPEVLLGMSDANHWTAWQVNETAVTLHIEPLAELICEALTVGYLRPALEAAGVVDADQYMVWYDTADLTQSPDKSSNAVVAYDRGQLAPEAFLRELGFTDADQTDDDAHRRWLLIELARTMPTLAPTLLAEAGVIDQATAALLTESTLLQREREQGAPDSPESDETDVERRTPPDDDNRPSGDREAAAVAAFDGVVYRALERAGSRLRSRIGKSTPGGPQAVQGRDPELYLLADATAHADLDALLDGAFTRVPDLCERYGLDPDATATALGVYLRALIGSRQPHDEWKLAEALGIGTTIDA